MLYKYAQSFVFLYVHVCLHCLVHFCILYQDCHCYNKFLIILFPVLIPCSLKFLLCICYELIFVALHQPMKVFNFKNFRLHVCGISIHISHLFFCCISQEYVNVGPPAVKKRRLLTEHQEEVMRERRTDLPTLYNALDPTLDSAPITMATLDQSTQQ